LVDSFRIYLILFRFALSSLVAFCIDTSVFFIVYSLSGQLLLSLVCARGAAIPVNYYLNRNRVFHDRKPLSTTVPRYLLLVVFILLASYTTNTIFSVPLRKVLPESVAVTATKMVCETALFFVSFMVQRRLFAPRPAAAR
jgi:putative flippase GtrA